MAKLTVTQIDWNGRGDSRTFTHWPTANALPGKLERIAQAYNFEAGHTRVILDGRDITDHVAEMKVS